MAWPKVWPKLRMARRPDSRSSWPTTQALISQLRRTACASAAVSRAHQPFDVRFDPVEQRRVGDRPVLDDFGQPGAEFARRQGVQRVEVADHQPRLVERADHVLAQRMVDAGLAADRRIDLREQGRRHLDERHAAHVAGRRKTRHVADHAAAQRVEHGLAIATVLQQRVEDQVERLPVLVLPRRPATRPHEPLSWRARSRAASRAAYSGATVLLVTISACEAAGHLRPRWQASPSSPVPMHDRIAAVTQVDRNLVQDGGGAGGGGHSRQFKGAGAARRPVRAASGSCSPASAPKAGRSRW